jgi:hypothetical protein
MASVFEVYNELHTIIIGGLKKHKKADEFTSITNLENYFEYSDWGDSSSIIARIGFRLFSEGTVSDPRKAEPMYLQSPF